VDVLCARCYFLKQIQMYIQSVQFVSPLQTIFNCLVFLLLTSLHSLFDIFPDDTCERGNPGQSYECYEFLLKIVLVSLQTALHSYVCETCFQVYQRLKLDCRVTVILTTPWRCESDVDSEYLKDM
jgi:hypothetical protein